MPAGQVPMISQENHRGAPPTTLRSLGIDAQPGSSPAAGALSYCTEVFIYPPGVVEAAAQEAEKGCGHKRTHCTDHDPPCSSVVAVPDNVCLNSASISNESAAGE